MEKKMLTDEISREEVKIIRKKAFEELYEIETPGKIGFLSVLWLKTVLAAYCATPIIAVAVPIIYEKFLYKVPPYSADTCFRLKTVFLYLLAFFPVAIIAGLPHRLVFMFQNKNN